MLERYRHALGEFIHDFAWLEVCLVHVLCAVAGVEDKPGPALFSGSRANDITGLIRKCYSVQERDLPPYLDRALAQVTVLNSARNEVVHFTTFTIEDEDAAVMATNQFRISGTPKHRILTPEVLHAMSKDVRILTGMLAVAEAENKEPKSTGELVASMTVSTPPWHYKSPPTSICGS